METRKVTRHRHGNRLTVIDGPAIPCRERGGTSSHSTVNGRYISRVHHADPAGPRVIVRDPLTGELESLPAPKAESAAPAKPAKSMRTKVRRRAAG